MFENRPGGVLKPRPGPRLQTGFQPAYYRFPVRPAAARRFGHGTLGRTSYGSQAVVVDKAQAKVETFSTVDHRLGFHTWRWRLDTELEGRVADSGWVGFFERRSNRLESVSIPP